MRMPKTPLTPAQERYLEAGERLQVRSQILRAGVCAMLQTGWSGYTDIDVAVEMLTEARDLQKEGYRLMNTVRRPIRRAKRG